MSIISLDFEPLLISTLLVEDPDYLGLVERNELHTIMPSYITLEDVFQRIGYIFRADGYTVTIGPETEPLIIQDDVLFSKTLAQVNMYAEQGYDFPSRFLAGARLTVPLIDIHAKIDVDKMDAVVDELAPLFAAKYRKAAMKIRAVGPPIDSGNLVVASAWNKYFTICAKIMAYLRTLPEEQTQVKPKRGYGVERKIDALFGKSEFGYISPMQGGTFSENERFMLQMYMVNNSAEIVELEDGTQLLVKPFSAFSAIGSEPCAPPVEQELPVEVPDMCMPPAVPVHQGSGVVVAKPTCEAEMLVWDYCTQDFNKSELQILHRQLLTGGRTETARALWLGLSKSRQQATARAIPTEWTSFGEVAQLMSKAAGVECTPDFLECAAARLLAMKGGVKYEPHNRRLRRA